MAELDNYSLILFRLALTLPGMNKLAYEPFDPLVTWLSDCQRHRRPNKPRLSQVPTAVRRKDRSGLQRIIPSAVITACQRLLSTTTPPPPHPTPPWQDTPLVATATQRRNKRLERQITQIKQTQILIIPSSVTMACQMMFSGGSRQQEILTVETTQQKDNRKDWRANLKQWPDQKLPSPLQAVKKTDPDKSKQLSM